MKEMSKEEALRAIEKLKAHIEQLDKPKSLVFNGRYISEPEVGAEYYALSTFGSVVKIVWEGDDLDKQLIQLNNCYVTEEAAKRAVRLLELEFELAKALAEDEAECGKKDWKNENQDKHHIELFRNEVRAKVSIWSYQKIAFLSEENRDAFRARFTDDELKLLITGEIE